MSISKFIANEVSVLDSDLTLESSNSDKSEYHYSAVAYHFTYACKQLNHCL